MKSFRIISLAAFSMLAFAACQQAEIAPEETPDATHTVTFVAGAPETKTTVTIKDSTANFEWTKADENKFTAYEDGKAATSTIGVLGDDGKMTITATFEGTSNESEHCYLAILNQSGNSTQILTKDAYDEAADILLSKEAYESDIKNGVLLQFKREVAIAKMTLKGLDPGENVNKVTVYSTSNIAGKRYFSGWSDQKTSLEVHSGYSLSGEDADYKILANKSGEAVVWFTCIPQTDATLTVVVEAADGDTYTKKFSKPITLTRGDVKGFRVAMNKLVDPHKDHNGWFLVKDARFLAEGDVIRIGCASVGKVAGALNGQILSSESATYENEQMVSVSSADDYTLGGNEGAWTLSSLTGKLGATALKKLSVDATAANYVGTWTIDIDSDGAATIAPTTEGYGRILCNTNSGMERFTTYESDVQSNMLLPGIYKKYGTPAETKKDQTISFDPTSYTATLGKENTYPTLTAQSTGAMTWSSSKTDVATINESTGEITLVAAGKTTISVSVAGDDTYNEGTGSYELTVENAPIVSTATWSLVTDASTLAEGDVIVIVAAGSNVALSTTQNSNNRGQQAITKNTNDNTVTIDDKVQQLTLGAGTKKGTFSLSTGDEYLYAASSSKNYLRTQATLDANASWTITIADKVATIKAQGTYTHNWVRYNSTDKVFSCYASGQGDVQIYRKNDTRASQSISYSAETGSIDKYTSDKKIPTLNVSGVKTTVSYTSSDETVATVSGTGEITPLKAGTTTITAIAAASAEYREAKASFVLTVTDSSAGSTGGETKYFVKVTSAPADWSGEYLIVCEDEAVAFDGSLTSLDAVSNTVTVDITDSSKIKAIDELLQSTFMINADGTIQSKSGYYIGQTSNANGLKSSTSTSYTNTLSFTDSGEFTAVSGGAYLRYNATSGQTRFRYFKSSTYASQKAIQLYKLEN